jgi:hypothetical protein
MAYKVVVRVAGKWQEVGLQHLNVESAREEARALWGGFSYLIVPA